MIWVVIANSSDCRIYNYEKKDKKLSLIKEIAHPEGKMKGTDLVSDRSGHYNGSTPDAGGAYSPRKTPKEIVNEEFARHVAKELEAARSTEDYKELILVAGPEMNGLLSQHLSKHVKDCIISNIKKDLNNLPDHELIQFLNHS